MNQNKKQVESVEIKIEPPDRDDDMLNDDGFTVDMIGQDFTEDFSPPTPAKGFFKTIRGALVSFVRKSTVLWSIYQSNTQPTDRLRRFVTENKPLTRSQAKKDQIAIGNYIKMNIDGQPTIVQVLGFKYLTGRHEELAITSCPIIAPKNSSKRGIGLLINLFEQSGDGKLHFKGNHPIAVDIKNFISHISPNELSKRF